MRDWTIVVVTTALTLGLLYLVGCAAPVPQEQRYGLLNCKPELRACLVFDTATGDLTVRSLPNLSVSGEHEVRN